MKFQHLITISILYYVIYISTTALFDYLPEYYKCVYTSILSLILIVLIIDGYSILTEFENIKSDNEITHTLLELQLAETNKKLFKHKNLNS
jgi:hypothetical protein